MKSSEVEKLKKILDEMQQSFSNANHQLKKIQRENNDQQYLNYYDRKKIFVQIMDELDELAEYFVNVDYGITRKIDNIAERLRFYDKA